MTTSAIIAALDVAGILCLVGAVAFAAVVVAELWWRTWDRWKQGRPSAENARRQAG